MARQRKQALAMIEPELVKVERSLWTVKRTMSKDGKTVVSTKFEPAERFKKEVLALSAAVGGVLQTAQDKMTVAINLRAFFEEWKAVQVGASGVPAFVKEFFDSTLPGEYGKPESLTRKTLNESSVFNGIRYILEKTGKQALEQAKERKALEDAGIAYTPKAIKEHRGKER